MPVFLRTRGYKVYFWSNERDEPIHFYLGICKIICPGQLQISFKRLPRLELLTMWFLSKNHSEKSITRYAQTIDFSS